MISKIPNTNDFYDSISFFADSGASEHIINKAFILDDFQKCNNKIIKCANKNNTADITIDGEGNLILTSNVDENRTFYLSNVIAARDISSNLISLRRFAEKNFGIYLNDSILEIFDKKTKQIYVTGNYVEPNWVITLKIKNNQTDTGNISFNDYSCHAKMVSLDELLSQSQIEVTDIPTDLDPSQQNIPSEIGREENRQLNLES